MWIPAPKISALSAHWWFEYAWPMRSCGLVRVGVALWKEVYHRGCWALRAPPMLRLLVRMTVSPPGYLQMKMSCVSGFFMFIWKLCLNIFNIFLYMHPFSTYFPFSFIMLFVPLLSSMLKNGLCSYAHHSPVLHFLSFFTNWINSFEAVHWFFYLIYYLLNF